MIETSAKSIVSHNALDRDRYPGPSTRLQNTRYTQPRGTIEYEWNSHSNSKVIDEVKYKRLLTIRDISIDHLDNKLKQAVCLY